MACDTKTDSATDSYNFQGPVTAAEIELVKEKLLSHLDKEKDREIQKNELAICLGVRLK